MDESQVELQWPTAYVATAFTLEVLLTAWLLYQASWPWAGLLLGGGGGGVPEP